MNEPFTLETFDRVLAEMRAAGLDRYLVPDAATPGLSAVLQRDGAISFEVTYQVGRAAASQYLNVGFHPHVSIDKARFLASTVIALAERGIDARDGLSQRLSDEIRDVSNISATISQLMKTMDRN